MEGLLPIARDACDLLVSLALRYGREVTVEQSLCSSGRSLRLFMGYLTSINNRELLRNRAYCYFTYLVTKLLDDSLFIFENHD